MQLIIIFIIAFLGFCVAARPFAVKASGKVRERVETNTLNLIAENEDKAEELNNLVKEQRIPFFDLLHGAVPSFQRAFWCRCSKDF